MAQYTFTQLFGTGGTLSSKTQTVQVSDSIYFDDNTIDAGDITSIATVTGGLAISFRFTAPAAYTTTDTFVAPVAFTTTATPGVVIAAGATVASGTGIPANTVVAKTLTLTTGLTSLAQIASANFIFDNGSKLIIGDSAVNITLDASANLLTGGDYSDYLDGQAGNDTLEGKDGDDILIGGDGIDTASYASATAAVVVTLDAPTVTTLAAATAQDTDGAGTDKLLSIEKLIGSQHNDTLTGNSAANTLDGGVGADILNGGDGGDTYVITAGDIILGEVASPTSPDKDTVQASIDYTLPDNIENLVLLSGATRGNGNAANNVITGNSGNNVIEARGGDDTMIGSLGNDTYYVGSSLDKVTELTGEGIDTIRTKVNFTLPNNVENLQLTGAAATTGTGNALDNIIYANSGNVNNTLVGGGNTSVTTTAGGDTLSYLYASGGVKVNINKAGAQATGGSGTDTISLFEHVEGSKYDDQLTAVSEASATIATAATAVGINRLTGGLGNDTYIVSDLIDKVIEKANEGSDTIKASLNFDLSLAANGTANVENLALIGLQKYVSSAVTYDTTNITTANGNALNNVLLGNKLGNTLQGGAGNDTIDGYSGTDSMYGGAGNDVYYVAESTDKVDESKTTVLGSTLVTDPSDAGGIDLVYASASVDMSGTTLNPNYIENITLLEAAATIVTKPANLSKTLVVTAAELGGSLDGDTGLVGVALNINATGNALNNIIIGNEGNNSIVGGAGNDTLYGSNITNITASTGSGNDTIDGGAGLDTISGGAGNDSIRGGTENDTLYGNVGNDNLDGGTGVDKLVGGAGNDTYTVDSSLDVVTEAANEGTDTVTSTAPAFILASNVENLTLSGAAAVKGTGNTLANTIIGSSAANVLIGMGGVDTFKGLGGADVFTGGTGIDTYQYTALTDSGVFTLTGGVVTTDTVAANTTVDLIKTFTIGQDIISLSLTGATLNAASFMATDPITAVNQINYETVGTDTVIHVNTTGDVTSDMDILLTGVVALSASDFGLV